MKYRVVEGDLPLKLSGNFKPWAIEVGHSKVLLRGFLGGDEDVPARVFDVVFQDVSRMSLSDFYSGLVISDAGLDALRAEERRIGCRWRGATLFRVSENHPFDFIVAGVVVWAEVSILDVKEFPLMQEMPRPDAIKGGKAFRLRGEDWWRS